MKTETYKPMKHLTAWLLCLLFLGSGRAVGQTLEGKLVIAKKELADATTDTARMAALRKLVDVSNALGNVQEVFNYAREMVVLSGKLVPRKSLEDQIESAKKELASDTTDMKRFFALKRLSDLSSTPNFKADGHNYASEMIALGQKLEAAQRAFALPYMAKASFNLGKLEDASKYASELLTIKPDGYPDGSIHDGNLVLGRIAVRDGRLEDAKKHLLAAGQTSGSPVLGSFGPNMSLAKDLLEKGEGETVLRYFEQCRGFWKMPKQAEEKLDAWTKDVKAGKTPDFGANLKY